MQRLHDASPALVTNSLEHDDEILARMNELISTLPDLDFQNELERIPIQTLNARLTGFISDEIRCRLDRTYLEALTSSHASNGTEDTEQVSREATLKAELGSLHTEIGAVAQMFIEQAYAVPLREAVMKKAATARGNIGSVLEHVSNEENLSCFFFFGLKC